MTLVQDYRVIDDKELEESDKVPSSGWSGRVWIFVLISVLLVSTAVFLSMFLLYYFKYQNRDINNECTTLECVKTASMLARKMDVTVDPCEDFDQFACGNFHKTTYLRDDQVARNALTSIVQDTKYFLKGILQESIKDGDWKYVVNMKNLYKSCMDEDKIEDIGLQPFLDSPQAKEWPTLIGRKWPGEVTFDFNDVLRRYMEIAIQPFVSYEIIPDPMNSSWPILVLEEPTLGLSRENLLKDRDSAILQAYETYLREMAEVLGAEASVAAQDAKAQVDLEIEIAKIKATAKERKTLVNMYNPTTLGEIGSKFTYIDIPGAIRAAFSLVDINVEDDQSVNNEFPKFYSKLAGVLRKAGKRAIMNKFGFAYATRQTKGLSKALRKIYLNFVTVYLGITDTSQRWEVCQGQVEYVFPMALAKDYAKEKFSEESKKYINSMVDNLEDAFRDQLRDADWMSDNTRQEAYAKLEKMTRKIGYPDKNFDYEDLEEMYKDFTMTADNNYANLQVAYWNRYLEHLKTLRKPVDKDRWRMAPFHTNAYYSVPDNEVVFLAGVMQPPLYSKQFPDYLNYGTIGYMIGHEITHGFDDEGRLFDKDGTFRDWWQKDDSLRYANNCQCFIDQYGNFRDASVQMNVSGTNTLSENVADNGGLEASFNAYKKLVREKGDSPTLPGLGLTDDQLFFVGYAQIHCEKATLERKKMHLAADEHAPGRFRTIGVVQNSADFAKVFNCPVGSPMNPEKKCSLW
ncbi:hypothetical protein EGW08_003914 [Elysia chlorotica]|uniref:Peptidase M13 C-terminal domain-containing protein n=1 Tax=Elysia chlorotica TaxID=188477 RepID=A0A433U3H5_ELYCH|nr:hypothetical protein EGW08_003914 [Elysia chlorotica]